MNNEIVRWGGNTDDKRDFLRLIKSVRKNAFKSQTVKSSFRDRGIWPWDGSIVCDTIDPHWEDEPVLQIYGTPSPPREFPSSATNSPPDTDQRFSRLEDKLGTILEDSEPDLAKVQKYLKRAIRGGKLALQNASLAQKTITKMQSHKNPNQKTKRWVKGKTKSPLSSIAGNMLVQHRRKAENKHDIKLIRSDARQRDYWHRAQLALQEKTIAERNTEDVTEDQAEFSFTDRDR